MSKPHGPGLKATANGARDLALRPKPTTRNADRAAKAGRTYAGPNAPRQQRAAYLTARIRKEFDKARTNAKRAIKAGDAERAQKHTKRASDLANRMERAAKHVIPGRWLN